ncbi:MAG: hypothetical protein U1E65_30015 [Myxococcota bacterium]
MRTHSTTFQIGAKAQAITIQADEALALSMTRAIQGARDGRISAADEKRIMQHITDGDAYAKGEKLPARAMLAATDDRVKVFMQVGKYGKKVQLRLSDPAEKALVADLAKFYGHLGGEKAAKISASAAQKLLSAE